MLHLALFPIVVQSSLTQAASSAGISFQQNIPKKSLCLSSSYNQHTCLFTLTRSPKSYFRDFACNHENSVDIDQDTQKTEVHCHISCISSTSKYLQLFRLSPSSTTYVLQFSRARQHGPLACLYQGKFDIDKTRPWSISALIKKNRTDEIAKLFSAPKKSPFQNLVVIRRTNIRLKLVCSKSESAEHGPTCLATSSKRL